MLYLECKGRAVKQFQEVQVLLRVQRDQRGAFRMTEGRIRTFDDLLQVLRRNFGGRDVQLRDLESKVLEGKVAPIGLPRLGQGGDLLRDEQATVRSQSLQDNILERKLCRERGVSKSHEPPHFFFPTHPILSTTGAKVSL